MSQFISLLFMVATIAGTSVVALVPSAGGAVAVIGWPGTSPEGLMALVARSGGALLGTGLGGHVVYAQPQDRGFVGRLYRAGAALVLGASGAGCGGAASDVVTTGAHAS